ncbi:MAG: amino acid carrier protein, partial [Gammaproteobacteria bacterium]|nr:amino acid carrier protein [Gammaproteobacteria bacterium]
KSHWAWLGTCFALFGAFAGFGIGNTIQANSVADVLNNTFAIPHMLTGIIMAVLAALVLVGGIKRIAGVAGKLVPFMATAYVLSGLIILIINYQSVPPALALIFTHAFTPAAATGGFAGAAVWAAIRFGVARGIFSNEAGLGSAPIAHAAASTDSPVQQGRIAMLGTFIDTIIICSITGLVIISTGAWSQGETGASLSSAAFELALPGIGGYIVAIGLSIFAFTTILGWSFYSEKCVEYLLGERAITPFRVLWIIAVPIGATASLDFIWLVADTLNALMAIPNLIALILLSPVVFKLTKEHFNKQ